LMPIEGARLLSYCLHALTLNKNILVVPPLILLSIKTFVKGLNNTRVHVIGP